MRKIVDQVRGKGVNKALNMLHFLPHRAARPTEKTIQSAVYNLIDQNQDEPINEDELVIREIYVDEAPTTKRFKPAARGRTHPIKKRSSHLTVVVGTPEEEVTEA
jgi:large subunit ribosomal protein L22